MNRYGIEELLRHIIYVNKKEDLKPISDYNIYRVLFFVLGYCYKYGFDISYNLMFEKSVMGAYSHHLDRGDFTKYGKVDFDKGVAIPSLLVSEEVNNIIIKTIELSEKDNFAISRVLVNSKHYLREIDEINKVKESSDFIKFFPFWSKKDIAELFDAHESIVLKDSLPTNEDEYEILSKYLSIYTKYNEKASFSASEMRAFHRLAHHKIRFAEEFGVHHEELLD